MDDDQQFCLRWNNHQSTLISVFDTLLENGTLVDCTLAAEGKFLKAHKVVLSACSPYFASLLSQQYDKHPIFILKDVKFQELRAMMDYMYRGEVNISQDQLAALLKAAESLQIKGLSDSRSGGTASGSGGGGGGGGSSGGNNAGQKQPTNEHKQMPVPASVIGKGGSSSGYTLEQKRSRHAMGGSSIESQELSGSREGSSSPTSRKRKKMRRRSLDNIMADNHEHSNSSSHSLHVNSSVPPSNTSTAIPPVPTIVATSSSSLPTTSISAAVSGGSVAGLNVTKKTEIVSNTTKLEGMEHDMDNDNEDDDDDNQDENEKPSGHGKKEQNHKRNKSQHIDTDNGKDNMLIEPKSEYDDGNDENVEDLTLDEEELLDDLEQAGPSHGGGEGSSQEYAQWQVDRSQDEVFMPAQEAAGQQRDPQGNILDFTSDLSDEIIFEIVIEDDYNSEKEIVIRKRHDIDHNAEDDENLLMPQPPTPPMVSLTALTKEKKDEIIDDKKKIQVLCIETPKEKINLRKPRKSKLISKIEGTSSSEKPVSPEKNVNAIDISKIRKLADLLAVTNIMTNSRLYKKTKKTTK